MSGFENAFVTAPGEGERIWFLNNTMTVLAPSEATGGAFSLVESLVPPGFGPPLHVHESDDESFYILEGELEIVCGGEHYTAAPGAFAYLPRGIAHTFRVTSATPCRLLTLATPGGIEDFFREAGRPAEGDGLPPTAPPDVAALKSVAARHGNQIVGPPLSSPR
jgi:mannose-6-phosphate isomerase-like protein (cupin superfamily)